jgi:hypothetical protein
MVAGAGVVVIARRALAPDKGKLPPLVPLHAYRVEYDTTFTGGVHNDEVNTVERPFNSLHLVSRGGQPVSGQLTNDQGLYFSNPSGGWSLLTPGLQRAANDPQTVQALQAALREGLASVRGHEVVVGHRCTLVRTGGGLGEVLRKPTASNHADVCVDPTGVILDYRLIIDGKLGQEMRASHFDPNPVIGPNAFVPSPPVHAEGLVQSVPLTPATLAILRPRVVAPAGLAYIGGLVRIEPSQQGTQATTTLLFRRGDDLVTADYLSTGSAPAGSRVALGGGHIGYLQLNLLTSSLVVSSGSGTALELTGADPARLEAIGRGLTG